MEYYTMNRVSIEPYKPDLKKLFSEEKKRLEKVFVKEFEIHHIGSTAVPGLGGKNIVDVMLLAPDDRRAAIASRFLESMWYVKSDEVPISEERLFFRCMRRFRDGVAYVHLSLMWKNSDRYKDCIIFRDYMREHPKEAERYFKLKKEWAEEVNYDRKKYSRKKASYIREIMKKARSC